MYGLEAIMTHNGFGMAAAGITIVFSALVALSFIISQLHKLLAAWDERRTYVKRVRELFNPPKREPAPAEKGEPLAEVKYYDNIHESARQFNLLIQAMGEPFSLPELIGKAEARGIAHAHSITSHLIWSKLIVPDREGFFMWHHDAYKRLLSDGEH